MKHIYLRPMFEWLVEINHGWSLPVGILDKGLKKHLPTDLWSMLEKTYAGSSIADNWQALYNTLDLSRLVSIQVGAYLGCVFPEQLHRYVRDYIVQIQNMSD